jgi:hypothetical protein
MPDLSCAVPQDREERIDEKGRKAETWKMGVALAIIPLCAAWLPFHTCDINPTFLQRATATSLI